MFRKWPVFYGDTLWKMNLEATEDFLVSSEKVPSVLSLKSIEDLLSNSLRVTETYFEMPETCWVGDPL